MVADPTICLDNRRQSAYPGPEKHGDDPCSTHHNDTGSTVGGTPVRATVLPFVRRRHAVVKVVVEIP
jgi:hypothetical protein